MFLPVGINSIKVISSTVEQINIFNPTFITVFLDGMGIEEYHAGKEEKKQILIQMIIGSCEHVLVNFRMFRAHLDAGGVALYIWCIKRNRDGKAKNQGFLLMQQ